MAINTISKEFFEEKYRANDDPWEFSSSSYELHRYAEIIGALEGRAFDSAFEPGCSIGVLTERLASRCRRLQAMDISPTAVGLARRRCASFPNVSVLEGSLPDDMPAGSFDLIVFSEIEHYFERGVLRRLRDRMIDRLTKHGVLIGVHWIGESTDHLLGGDAVHNVLRSSNAVRLTTSQRYDDFLLESWERT